MENTTLNEQNDSFFDDATFNINGVQEAEIGEIFQKLDPIEEYTNITIQLTIIFIGTFANTLVIYLTWKHAQFHQVYMYIRAAYSVLDIIMSLSILPAMCSKLILEEVSQKLVCLSSQLIFGTFLGCMHMVAFIALERYFFFCKPFIYERIFNGKTIIASTILFLSAGQAYIATTGYIYGREYQDVLGVCHLNGRYHNFFQVCIFFAPSIICTAVSVFKIKQLLSTIERAVISQQTTVNKVSEPVLRRNAIAKALRLIFLVSGAFWGTFLPTIIVRTALMQIGYNLNELDINHPAMVVGRSTMYVGLLSTVIDPIIYFSISKELRSQVKKMVIREHTTLSFISA